MIRTLDNAIAMPAPFAGNFRNSLRHHPRRKGLCIAVFCLTVLSGVIPEKGEAQANGTQAAVSLVEQLYLVHQTLIDSVLSVGVAGGPADRFFAPALVAQLRDGDAGTDPLTGLPHTQISGFDISAAPDPEAPAKVMVLATVEGGETPRVVRFTVEGNEAPIITAVEVIDSDSDAINSPPTEPAKAILNLPFTDDFTGSDLSSNWTVMNRDLDAYVLENGEIYAVATGGEARFDNPQSTNFFQLNNVLPDEDFDLVVTAKLEPKVIPPKISGVQK